MGSLLSTWEASKDVCMFQPLHLLTLIYRAPFCNNACGSNGAWNQFLNAAGLPDQYTDDTSPAVPFIAMLSVCVIVAYIAFVLVCLILMQRFLILCSNPIKLLPEE